MYLCRGLRPRRHRTHQADTMCRHGPQLLHAKGCRGWSSRGSIARLWRWLSTLRRDPYESPRKTRFRLLARLYEVGLATYKAPVKGFEVVVVYIFASLPKLLGARRILPNGVN
jgi:hypothetical protein